MFDWFFNLFKKKEEEAPIKVDYSVHDLKPGYLLDYDMESWEVLAAYDYEYVTHSSKEYKIRSGSKTMFLNVSDSNDLILGLSEEANINFIHSGLRTGALDGKPMTRVNWEGEAYTIKETAEGKFREEGRSSWAKFSSWEYVNPDGTKFIYVSKWEDNSIECYTGTFLKEYQISNILAST